MKPAFGFGVIVGSLIAAVLATRDLEQRKQAAVKDLCGKLAAKQPTPSK